MENEVIRKYSLEELKKMKKKDVIKLDMRSLPLAPKTLTYFNNKYATFKKRREIQNWNVQEKDYIFSLIDLLLSKTEWYGRRGEDISSLCETLGMKQGDIFSFDFIQSISRKELLQCTVDKLQFPNTQFMDTLVYLHSSTVGKFTLLDLLQTNVEETSYYRGATPVAKQKIRDYVLKLGFKIGEYPFLKQDFWEKTDEEVVRQKKGLVEGKKYRDYGVTSPFVIIMNVMVDKIIIAFEGTYDECAEWLQNHTRTRQ